MYLEERHVLVQSSLGKFLPNDGDNPDGSCRHTTNATSSTYVKNTAIKLVLTITVLYASDQFDLFHLIFPLTVDAHSNASQCM